MRYLKDESGGVSLEYGLVAALIAIVCVVVFNALGGSLGDLFTSASPPPAEKTSAPKR
jgi:pilus assembly protein Flp/PilA